MIDRRKEIVACVFLFLSLSCNKNTDQLPPVKTPPQEVVIPAKLNGIEQLQFIFRQEKSAGKDTVWLSIKNPTGSRVSHLSYIVELCKAVPQTFYNCDLQHIEQRADTIEAGTVKKNIFFWADKNIALSDSLINVGIISFSESPAHPLANVYHNIYAVFESEDPEQTHYGKVRGYILADGTSLFRLKAKDDALFNASGQFTGQLAFDGVLTQEDEAISPFILDSVDTDAGKMLIDLTDQKLKHAVKTSGTDWRYYTVTVIVYSKELLVMNYLSKQLICWIVLIVPVVMIAQQAKEGEIKYKTAEFKFTSMNASGDYDGEQVVTLKGIYKSEEKTFTIEKDDTVWFTLNDPLSRSAFYMRLTGKLNECHEEVKYYSEASLNDVLNWLYQLKAANNGPRIGALMLGTITIPYENGYTYNTKERVRFIERKRNQLFIATTLLEGYKKKLVEKMKELRESIVDQPGQADPYNKEDIPVLDEVIRHLSDESYTKLPAPLYREFRQMTEHLDGANRRTHDSLHNQIKALRDQQKTVKENMSGTRNQIDSLRQVIALPVAGDDTQGDGLSEEEKKERQQSAKTALDTLLIDSIHRSDTADDLDKRVKSTSRRLREFMTRLPGNYDTIINPATDSLPDFKTAEIKYIHEDYAAYTKGIDRLTDIRREFRSEHIYEIRNVSLQFERGYLERIQVTVENEVNGTDIYENIYAIGFSSINNLKALETTRLFIRKSPLAGFYDGIFLSDVIPEYRNLLDLYTRDYSPADTAVNEIKPEYSPIILNKEKTIHLFDSKIYTDLQGIQEDKPNGLIQIEASRKFNIHTYRRQLFKRADWGYFDT